MKNRFFKFITAAVASLAITPVLAKDITVLRLAPPGGGMAAWTEGIATTLKDNGYKVSIKGFNTCQEGAHWFKNNSHEPVVMMVFSDYVLMNISNKDNPFSCDFPIREDSLVTILGKWYHFICGRGEEDLAHLLSEEPKKIGSWNSPVQMKIVQDQLEDIGARNFKLIGYSSGKSQLQSIISGDTQYTILSSETMTGGIEGRCFATSAPKDVAETMGRVSYGEINPNTRHQGSGLWPIALGFNTDNEELKHLLLNPNTQSELLAKLISSFNPVHASIPDQVKELHERAKETIQ